MSNPIMRIHNVQTGEIIDRPMTDEEYQEYVNPTTSPSPSELANG